MICKSCGKDAQHIKIMKTELGYIEICNNCSELSILGPSTDQGHIKAIYTDNNGSVIPVDGKGNIVDKKDNPYNNDSRGWKHAGKRNIKY